jgi:hypothetical protein
VQALSAAAGPLMRTYPERAIDLLNLLLPGIDVNDIWKCTDIFILMSDLLELMPVADLTKQHALATASKTQYCGSGSGIGCLFDPWTRIRDPE